MQTVCTLSIASQSAILRTTDEMEVALLLSFTSFHSEEVSCRV